MNNIDTPPNRLSNFLFLSSPAAFGEKQNTAAVKFLRKINGIKNLYCPIKVKKYFFITTIAYESVQIG